MSRRYTVELRPAARRQVERLDPPVRARILRKLVTLEADPRPVGCVKLAGAEDLWRIRVGDYRVIYQIVDGVLVVTVVHVGHRREVYRGL